MPAKGPVVPAGAKDAVRRPVRWTADFAEGVRLYWRGFRAWGKDPRLMALGLLPGALTWALLGVLGLGMWFWLDDIALWAARRVTDSEVLGMLIAAGIALAAIAALLLVAVYAFMSISTVLGQWFYERISHEVDNRCGTVPDGPQWPWWRNALRGMREGVCLASLQVPLVVSVFLIGFVPVAGTLTAWTLGALIGGWFTALELTSVPFERRGLVLRDRRAALGGNRARTLGFGVMAYLMAIVPPLAVATMPAGIVAGTLLARRSLGESTTIAAVRADTLVDSTGQE